MDFGFKAAWDLERLEPNSFFPVPASVVFAENLGLAGKARPLAGEVERWYGRAGSADVVRGTAAITDTGVRGDSAYAEHSRQGATIVPRALFFVNETDNPAIVQAPRTVTVDPRRGNQDKAPWKNLDLTEITGQAIEDRHMFDVHLGETVAPYVTLEPLKALLPLKRGDEALPASRKGTGGVRLAGLERSMRARWRIVSRLWEQEQGEGQQADFAGATRLSPQAVGAARLAARPW